MIVKAKAEKVDGIVYELTNEQGTLLDTFEKGYERKKIVVKANQEIMSVFTYIPLPEQVDRNVKPLPEYFNGIVDAVTARGFSKTYIKKLLRSLS